MKKEELKKEQLEQLKFVNDILDKMKHLANKTNRNDYQPSCEESEKILTIKRYADVILNNNLNSL